MGLGGLLSACEHSDCLVMSDQESLSSTCQLQPIQGLQACGQRRVNFWHLLGVSVSAKQLKGYGSEYYLESLKVRVSHTVVSDVLWPHGHTNLLCPWDFPRQEYWRGLPFPSPGNFLTQGSSPGLLHCGQILYPYVYVCVSHSVVSDSLTPWMQNIFKSVQ